MINVKALNKLLTDNSDGKLIIRWFMMTPNGSLLAYTTPSDMRELRDQVALISMTWKEQLDVREEQADELGHPNRDRAPVMLTMTMEFENRNLLIRYLQSNLLLVLEGGVPPRRARQLQVTTEGPHDARYPGDDSGGANGSADERKKAQQHHGAPSSPSAGSEASTTMSVRRRNHVLDIHRKKLDSMTGIIRSELAKARFEMPKDPDGRFF
ncbi:hypothetical protein CAC42_467 [Sphaceloma murrayae]|uniref:Uncharacterized protein n=1 Tax=Sphaceloma murrayae TaxID=2082308 RepID=A0A2K1R3J7_9PEZI|nr:hypothetical protein CAC42_467 [Sphaceloma murrayae]